MIRWWIGCSGFHYKAWLGKFYPPDLPVKKWFGFYCRHFNSLEVNASHYRFPRAAELAKWYAASPHEFRFVVKAPRLITHYKRFHNARRETGDFYTAIMEGLGDKLGAALFQLHPVLRYTDDNLNRMLETLDPMIPNVVEFRHPSWWTDKVSRALRTRGMSFCGISYPELPDQVMKTSATVYYRFHGVPRLYRSSYRTAKLAGVTETIRALRGVRDAYCFFNNDIDAAAVRDASRLGEIVNDYA